MEEQALVEITATRQDGSELYPWPIRVPNDAHMDDLRGLLHALCFAGAHYIALKRGDAELAILSVQAHTAEQTVCVMHATVDGVYHRLPMTLPGETL